MQSENNKMRNNVQYDKHSEWQNMPLICVRSDSVRTNIIFDR